MILKDWMDHMDFKPGDLVYPEGYPEEWRIVIGKSKYDNDCTLTLCTNEIQTTNNNKISGLTDDYIKLRPTLVITKATKIALEYALSNKAIDNLTYIELLNAVREHERQPS